MARPSHEPTETARKQVEAMAAYGVPEEDLAAVLDIDAKTLRKHYRRELDTGHVRANVRVAESLYRTAIKGGREGTTAAIFWLKVRAGWSEFNAPRLRPPGKKELEREAALNAGVRTDWEDLLDCRPLRADPRYVDVALLPGRPSPAFWGQAAILVAGRWPA